MNQHFILIGTPKSGSSSLYKYLNDHPQTALSKVKEYNFFMNMGYDWKKQDKTIRIKKKLVFSLGYLFPFVKRRIIKHYYKSCYKEKDKVSGDGSICYYYFPEVPKRIKAYVPNSKLILLLRNPIDRLYSNYWMHYKAQKKRKDWVWKYQSFEDYIDKNEHKKEINHYDISLQRWLKYFSLEDILIITSEDFFKSRTETLRKIESFIGIDPYNYPTDHWVSPHAKKGRAYNEMDELTRQKLIQYFKPHVQRLKELIKIDLNWQEFE